MPPNQVAIAQWCSQRDVVQLVERCVAAPEDLRLDISCGVSDNPYLWVDLEHARALLGYVPQDRAPDPTWETMEDSKGLPRPLGSGSQ